MTKQFERECQASLQQAVQLGRTLDSLFKPLIAKTEKKRPSIAARCCADELEALDMANMDEEERQPWTPAYKDMVAEIIDRRMP